MRRARTISLLWATAVAVPLVVDVAVYASYLASYAGACEPHPTDIPSHACSFGEYASDFFGDGFAVMGFVITNVVLLVVAALVALAATSVVVLARRGRHS